MLVQGLGDIWLLVRAATFALQTLKDAAKNAPREVKDLIEDVANLKLCLKRIEGIVNNQGAVLKPHDDIKKGMVQVLRRCAEMVDGLERIAASHKSIVQTEGEVSEEEAKRKQWLLAMDKAYRAYLRIKWTTMDAAINDIRTLLQQHMSALQLIMQSVAASVNPTSVARNAISSTDNRVHREQMTQLQHDMRQILQVMEQTGVRVNQIFQSTFDAGSRSPISATSDSESQSPISRISSRSPFSAPPQVASPVLPPERTTSPNVSSGEGSTREYPSSSLDPLNLPPPLNEGNLLDTDFPTVGSRNDFPYARPAPSSEQDRFFREITTGREHVEMSVLRSVFVKSVH